MADQNEEVVRLDGEVITPEALDEAKQKSNVRIIEDKKSGPGNYKTLQRLTEAVA